MCLFYATEISLRFSQKLNIKLTHGRKLPADALLPNCKHSKRLLMFV